MIQKTNYMYLPLRYLFTAVQVFYSRNAVCILSVRVSTLARVVHHEVVQYTYQVLLILHYLCTHEDQYIG